ncbi:MAG: hypothetical protein DYG94_03050 [Leptolyngbya sp. PLA3]|nr:MAG: hypothetical protein EDM82_11250 [Cyanobacteria bacterium CYA]MCE7967707.1 hypothetical protein [Leptolyngbya sp. PL-A3]
MTTNPFAVAFACVAAHALAAPPTDWTFQLQCRSSLDPDTPAFNLPIGSSLSSQYVTLDDDGGVAIRVVLGLPDATEGVFYGRQGVGGLIHTVNSTEPVYSSGIALRNGRIAMPIFFSGVEVRNTTGALEQYFAPGGPEGVSGFSSLSITSDGALGYRGDFGSEQKNIIDEFVSGVRTQTQVANTFDGLYSYLFSPKLNDARQMAAKVFPQAGGQAIYRWEPGGSRTLIAQTGAIYNAFVNSIALADNGLIAFSGRRTADARWQVMRADGTSETLIAQGGDLGIVDSSIANFPPVVNSDGLVALRASDAVSTALWVGDGDGLVKLIEYGQSIDTDIGPLTFGFDFGGLTGKQVMNGAIAINDDGQVAFAAFLNNGTIGVFVATPDDTCAPDFTGEGVLDFFDVQAFLAAFAAHDPGADLAPDGLFDFFDVQAFLQAFAAGCP